MNEFSFQYTSLGIMYATGDKVTKDSVEAVKWLSMAARHGGADAQNVLKRLESN